MNRSLASAAVGVGAFIVVAGAFAGGYAFHGASTTVRTVTITSTVTVTPQPAVGGPAATPARTASANQRTSPSTSQPAETPLLIAGSWSGRDPSSIQFGGDGGSDVGACGWSAWRSTEALGYCTGQYNNCVPDCAQGTSTNIQVQVTLTTPADGHWTRMVFTYSAGSDVWTYPSHWAVGADNSNGG